MSHRGADELSAAIDTWLSRTDHGTGGDLGEVLAALEQGLQPLSDVEVRERVRRRLATATPHPRSPQALLLGRAVDEVDRLQHRIREDEYVPWTAVLASTLVVAAAVGLAVWLQRRERNELA